MASPRTVGIAERDAALDAAMKSVPPAGYSVVTNELTTSLGSLYGGVDDAQTQHEILSNPSVPSI